ncbi:MAG: hypothetical protein LBM62_09525 [Mediterranea sp.]|jgi:hypothetical protein|nr:hypothetical protein [Mediterranea sp.]
MKTYSLTLSIATLLICLPAWLVAQPVVKTTQTHVYEAVEQDSAWTIGKIIDYIYFVKYNSEGLPLVKNRLTPEGKVADKVMHLYDSQNRVIADIWANSREGVTGRYLYHYDEQDNLNRVFHLNAAQDTVSIRTAEYDEQRRLIRRTESYTGTVTISNIEYDANDKPTVTITSHIIGTGRSNTIKREASEGDTLRLKRGGQEDRFDFINRHTWAITHEDEVGNWTEQWHFGKDSVPQMVMRRVVTYFEAPNHRKELRLSGEVKRVEQTSYIALPRADQSVDKGAKQGEFFVYEFDKDGRKSTELLFNNKGVSIGKITYIYDDNGYLNQENLYNTAGTLTETHAYTFNDKLKRHTECTVTDAANNLLRKIRYRYDSEGNLVKVTAYRPDGSIFRDEDYLYDSYGNVIQKSIHNTDGSQPSDTVRFAYNLDGDVITEQRLLPDGWNFDTYTYKYGNNRHVVSGTDALHGQEPVDYTYRFHRDSQGNWRYRLKYINGVPVLYEQRNYEYYENR